MDSSVYIWLYRVISYTFRFYEISLIIYILSSWFPMARGNFIMQFLEDICEPYLKLFRKLIPPFGMLDFSPIFALMALGFLERIIFSLIFKGTLF